MTKIPDNIAAERDQIVAEIHAVFLGVRREGGVSWSQADLLDGVVYSEEEFRAAALKDSDAGWQDLVGNRMFEGCPSEWSFLDPIGYRYYLPACMITYLTFGEEAGCLSDELTLRTDRSEDLVQYHIRQWSLLDQAQRVCVGRFLQFMGRWLVALSPESDNYWQEAHESYWSPFSSQAP